MNIVPHITAILEAALQAPSGENSQPWKFAVNGNTIELFNDEASDTSLYNYQYRGSYVALGAAIENMCIAAAAGSYDATVTLFPEPGNTVHVASITLAPGIVASPKDAMLYGVITERTSNRKPYTKEALDPAHAAAMIAAVEGLERYGLVYQRVTEREAIGKLAEVGATNEEVMLQNKSLHQFFFSHLTWSKEEDAKKKVGFFIRTLELPLPVRALFKLMAHWPVMVFFIKLGFPAVVRKANAATYASAAEFGILSMPGDTAQDFIWTGRALQRIWLTATAFGIRMQPLTGSIFLHFASAGLPDAFSSQERELILNQIESLYSMLTHKRSVVTCMFRAGYGPLPSARATRYTLEERLI
jgi:nitroreductase